MLCTKCHAEVPPDAAFCPKCGTAVAGAASPRAVTPTERMQGAQAAVPQEPEHELWRGGYSAKAMYGGWAFAVLVTVAAVVLAAFAYNPMAWLAAAVAVPLVWVIAVWIFVIRLLNDKYTLTTQRFLHKKGILSRTVDQTLLVDIDDVKYYQGLVDRFVNVGKITLYSTDKSDKELELIGIDEVERVTNLIDNARREERRKRAIYLANA
ncbi:MAG TPA: PH domain-containing protein [Pirellulaceae bacterium]